MVLQLLAICQRIIARVAGTPHRRPADARVESWRRQPVPSRVFHEGLQAIEWTLEERGLTGLSWRMDMEAFFESWLEALGERVARQCGARMRCGRRGQTAVALEWQPPWVGSPHAEEIEMAGWGRADDVLREHHSHDVRQVLAYSTLFDAPRVVACPVCPCRRETFESLRARGRVVTRARVPSRGRTVELAIACATVSGDAGEVVKALAAVAREPTRA